MLYYDDDSLVLAYARTPEMSGENKRKTARLYMTKPYILIILIAFVFSTQPLLAHADYTPYFPHCYDHKLTSAELQSTATTNGTTSLPADFIKANNTVAGTCHFITISNTVSVGKALQSAFWLGEHYPLSLSGGNKCSALITCFPPQETGQFAQTKYSEYLNVGTSTADTEMDSVDVGKVPTKYVLLDKSGFLPLLKSAFQKAGITFLTSHVPDYLTIHIYNKNIITYIMNSSWYVEQDGNYRNFSTSTVMDFAYVSSNPHMSTPAYDVYTENLHKYGNYIYGPKGDLIESQYTSVDYGNDTILTNKDLRVSLAPTGHWYLSQEPVVPETSPLKSVHNYWMFTKIGGQIVLAWEKSVYGLDDGTTRTLTRGDTKINVAILFGSTPHAKSSTKAKKITVNNPTQTPAATTSTSVAPAPQGFFVRIWSWITSWF